MNCREQERGCQSAPYPSPLSCPSRIEHAAKHQLLDDGREDRPEDQECHHRVERRCARPLERKVRMVSHVSSKRGFSPRAPPPKGEKTCRSERDREIQADDHDDLPPLLPGYRSSQADRAMLSERWD